MNQILVLENDSQVKTLLFEHGKTAHLTPRDGFGAFRYHVVWSDERGYYAATHYHGFEDPTDNGYTAIVIERSTTPIDVASSIIQQFLNANKAPGGPAYAGIVRDELEAN